MALDIFRYMGAGCFWIVSSESLVVVGNGAGNGMIQAAVLLLLLTAIILYPVLSTETRVERQRLPAAVAAGPVTVILSVVGFGGIIGSCLFVSTGILVSAGFTFNEVFFYRFPNFGFAFLLLVSAVVLNTLSDEKRDLVIGILVSAAAGCILLLALIGISFFAHGQGQEGVRPETVNTTVFWPLLFLYLGFERMTVSTGSRLQPKTIGLFLASGVILLLAWGYVSSMLVSDDRLADSSIPHMLAAGKIAAPWGRYLMGMALICGALAVVTRFLSISGEFLVSAGLLPLFPVCRKALPLLLGVGIASLMFAGVAGEDRIEVMIRTSLLLWMAYGAATIIGRGLAGNGEGGTSYPMFLSGVTVLAGCLAVFLFQGEYALNFKYTAFFLAGSALCVALLTAVRRLITINHETGGT